MTQNVSSAKAESPCILSSKYIESLFKIMSNDVKKKASEKVANDKVRTIKKEINELIRPLAQALERLQALRCSVDSVFNFLQGSFIVILLGILRYESTSLSIAYFPNIVL